MTRCPDRRVLALAVLATLLAATAGCAQQGRPATVDPGSSSAALHQAYATTLAAGSAAAHLTETVRRSGRNAGTITGTGHIDFRHDSSDLVFATAGFAGVEVLQLGSARYRRSVRAGQAPSAGWQRLPDLPSGSTAGATTLAAPQPDEEGIVTRMLGYLDDVGAGARALGPDPTDAGGHRYHVGLTTSTGTIGIEVSLDDTGRCSHEQLDAANDPPGTDLTLTLDLSEWGTPVEFPRPANGATG